MAEKLHLIGGEFNGLIVTLGDDEPIPRRWHVPVFPEIAIGAYAEPALAFQQPFGDFDEFAPALDSAGRPSRNDRGELVYVLDLRMRNGVHTPYGRA